MLDTKEIKSMLEKISEENNIRAYVAQYVLDELESYDDIKDWFNDLFQHGCSSGMIGGLIYYSDTHKFYDAHYDEIEELRNEYEESMGEPLKVDGDLKNWYAWFAYEETTRKLADELELDI